MAEKKDIQVSDEEVTERRMAVSTGARVLIKVERDHGQIWAALYDETGSHLLADVPYRGDLDGGRVVEGTTDEQGVLRHKDLPIGDYAFTIAGSQRTFIPTIASDEAEPHQQVVIGYQVEEPAPVEEDGEDDEVVDLLSPDEVQRD
jgi:hypothetical protein